MWRKISNEANLFMVLVPINFSATNDNKIHLKKQISLVQFGVANHFF